MTTKTTTETTQTQTQTTLKLSDAFETAKTAREALCAAIDRAAALNAEKKRLATEETRVRNTVKANMTVGETVITPSGVKAKLIERHSRVLKKERIVAAMEQAKRDNDNFRAKVLADVLAFAFEDQISEVLEID